MRAAFLLALALCASCLRTTEFRCSMDSQCTPGTCQTAVGYCSFADSGCSSGQRFNDSAGPYAGQCVGDQAGGDGGIDGPPIDGPAAGCPGNYNELTGGNPGHRYRKVPNNMAWVDQDNFCRNTSARAYLAVPDDAGELTALHTAAGGTFWVGVHDRIVEGRYDKVTGGTATFLPWAGGQPDNDPSNKGDCVAATATTFSDEDCDDSRPAVCECEP